MDLVENGNRVSSNRFRLYFKVVIGAFQMQKVKIEEVTKEYCSVGCVPQVPAEEIK